MQTRSKQAIGTAIFLVGLVITLGLALAPTWGDFEGMSYFSSGAGYGPFGGLHCPVLMGRSDTATISATLDNNSNKETQPYYEVEVSGVSATRKLEGQVTLPPHSSKTVEWSVGPNDIDLGYFIMNKIDLLPFAGNPTREATCGIMVLNLGGLSGGQIQAWGLAIGLIGMVAGLAVREGTQEVLSPKELNTRNGLRATGVAASLAMLTGFMGWWAFAMILCAITVLLAVILLRFAAA